MARMLPLSAALAELPKVTLGSEEIARLITGRQVSCSLVDPPAEVAALDSNGDLIAICRGLAEARMLQPIRVFRGMP